MGQRYRHRYQETGDIIDPSFFVLDNNELAGEVNGYLDRDNLAQADIAQNEIVADAFTKITAYGSATAYAPDMTVTTWQGGRGNNASGIQYITTEEAAVDCVMDVRYVLEWEWAGAGGSDVLADKEADAVEFRLLVDGDEVCRAGPFGDVYDRCTTFLMGQVVAVAGVHTIAVECLAARRKYEGLAIAGPCTYAVTINTRSGYVIQEKR